MGVAVMEFKLQLSWGLCLGFLASNILEKEKNGTEKYIQPVSSISVFDILAKRSTKTFGFHCMAKLCMI